MDKRIKHQRHKTLSKDELAELGPGKASFDTEAGRAAQGMRPDIGKEGSETEQPPAPPAHTGKPPSSDKPDDKDVT